MRAWQDEKLNGHSESPPPEHEDPWSASAGGGPGLTLMKLSNDLRDFQIKLDKIHPRYGDTMMLQFPDDDGIGL
jgi:hypothetical protein